MGCKHQPHSPSPLPSNCSIPQGSRSCSVSLGALVFLAKCDHHAADWFDLSSPDCMLFAWFFNTQPPLSASSEMERKVDLLQSKEGVLGWHHWLWGQKGQDSLFPKVQLPSFPPLQIMGKHLFSSSYTSSFEISQLSHLPFYTFAVLLGFYQLLHNFQ